MVWVTGAVTCDKDRENVTAIERGPGAIGSGGGSEGLLSEPGGFHCGDIDLLT